MRRNRFRPTTPSQLLAGGRIRLDGPPAGLTDELIAEAYSVAAFRGEHAGERFVLPWAPLR